MDEEQPQPMQQEQGSGKMGPMAVGRPDEVETLIALIQDHERTVASLKPVVDVYQQARNRLNEASTRLRNVLRARALER